MSFTQWRRRGTLAVAGLAVTAIAVPGLSAASAAKVPGPTLKLEIAQRSFKAFSFRGRVGFDPGMWLAALGSPLEFDVQRASYTKPVTLTQIIHPPYGGLAGLTRAGSKLLGQNATPLEMTTCPDEFFMVSVANRDRPAQWSSRPGGSGRLTSPPYGGWMTCVSVTGLV